MNSISWKTKALKQMRKLPAQAGSAVRLSVSSELPDLSTARNVKKLVNHTFAYRLRVGDYRVFFEFDGAVRIISIEEVRKRDEQTY